MRRGASSGLLLALALLACSPAFNWRNHSLGDLRFSLPCKPDKAQQEVPLAGRRVLLEMHGCEAAGALFAIGRIQVSDEADVPEVLQAWRTSALTALQSTPDAPRLLPMSAYSGIPGLVPAHWLQVDGQRPTGGAVQAQLGWLVRGKQIFHLAVYADQITPEMTEPLFMDVTSP